MVRAHLPLSFGRHFAVFVALLALLLTGCGLAKRAQLRQETKALQEQLRLSLGACDKAYPNRHAKPATPRVRCFIDAQNEFQQGLDKAHSTASPNGDLIRLQHARLLQAAQKYDQGKIDAAQFDVDLARITAETNSQLKVRQNNAAMASAAQQQAAAAQQQADAADQKAIQDAFTPRRSVQCNTYGTTQGNTYRSTVNCY